MVLVMTRRRPSAWPGALAGSAVHVVALCLGAGLLVPRLHADEPRLDDSASTARVKHDAASEVAAGPLRQRLAAWSRLDSTTAPSSPADLPRFETEVLVEAHVPLSLQRFFEGFDTRNGATFGSAPNHQEMWREMSPRQAATPVDLLAAVKAVVDLFRKDGPARFFIYRASDATHAWLLLREGDLPAPLRYGSPGVTFEALGGFASLADAQAAYERIEDALAERFRIDKQDARQRAHGHEPMGPPTPGSLRPAAPPAPVEAAEQAEISAPHPFVRP